MSVARAAGIAGVAESTWRRVERGASGTSIATLCAMCQTVGLDFVAQTYPGREPRLRDSGQLAIAQALARMASPALTMSLEVPAGHHGEAIDQVFWGPREIMAVEIERLVLDGQSQKRRAEVKRDFLASLHQRPVRLVIVVEDTRRNRAALDPHLPLFRRSLEAGSRDVFHAIHSGQPLGRDGLAWIRRRRSTSSAPPAPPPR